MAAVEVNDDGYVNKFDRRRALHLAQTCVLDDGNVSIPLYVDAIEELHNLALRYERQNIDFLLSALTERLTILRELCSGESKEHYSTVQSMVDYEIQHQLVERQDKPSGTVTMIRVQRTMEFVCAVLNKINDPTIPDEMLSPAIVEAYTQTLGRYHPQLMVVSIQMALPQVVFARQPLLASISGMPRAERLQWLLSMEQYMRKSIGSVRKVYADRGLLNLPQGNV